MVAGLYLFQVSDGANTVTLTSAPNAELEYVPKAPETGAPTVEESAEVAVGGASLAAALGERDKLQRLLCQAARVAGGSKEARVFVQIQRAPDLEVWRSEMLGGDLAEVDGEGYWPARGVVRCRVRWVRRAWWEGVKSRSYRA